MKRVLLFGATGKLGKKIAAELTANGYTVTAVVRNSAKQREMAGMVHQCRIANVMERNALAGICNGFDVVVSALGKPVSPNDRSKPTFNAVDLETNSIILQEAVKSGVKKFVYISAFHAEKYRHLEYFRVHHEFSERLKNSGLAYAIIKPPALFSAFLDMIPMAKKGFLFTMGSGNKKTNPIDEGELAGIVVAAIEQPNIVIEAGGKEVLTRHQINEVIQAAVNPAKKLRRMPMGLIKSGLPLLKLFSRNLYDKMAFFIAVIEEDTIAPQVGETRLKEYIQKYLEKEGTIVLKSKKDVLTG